MTKPSAKTAGDVRTIVDAELGGNLPQSSGHGINLRRCLIEPRKVKCQNTFPKLKGGKPLELWIVLEETPGTSDGYLIVFDEETHQFGLAAWTDSTPVFLGFYGTFLSTLECM